MHLPSGIHWKQLPDQSVHWFSCLEYVSQFHSSFIAAVHRFTHRAIHLLIQSSIHLSVQLCVLISSTCKRCEKCAKLTFVTFIKQSHGPSFNCLMHQASFPR